MRLDKILIGIGIFVLFISVGLGVMFGNGDNQGIFQDYNINASDSDFENLTKDINDVYDVSSDIKEDVLTEGVETATSWENMIIGGYKAFRSYLAAFGVVGKIVYAIGKTLQIPPAFLHFSMISLSIVTVFTIIYMIFRFMPRD